MVYLKTSECGNCGVNREKLVIIIFAIQVVVSRARLCVLFSYSLLSKRGSTPTRRLRKHVYSNILRILTPKNENFQIKISDIFHISAQNIDCGYSLEPPRSARRF